MEEFDNFNVVDILVPTEELLEEVNENSGWTVGERIVPSIYYQAFLAEGAWNSDDESTYRLYWDSESKSTVSAKVKVAEDSEEAETEEPSNDELEGGDESEEETPAEDEEESVPVLRENKFGYADLMSVVNLEITPSASLSEAYADYVNVIIDGKEYAGLDILNSPVEFFMNRDHEVIIDWLHGEIFEKFSVVVNR